MSITGVTIKERTGGYVGDGRWYETTYQVISDSATETLPNILTASHGGTSLPSLSDAYGDDATALCTRVAPARLERTEGNLKVWGVVARYDQPVTTTPSGNPLNDAVQVEWGFATYARMPVEDVYGNLLINSAGDEFDPGVEVEHHRSVVTIIRNEASFDPLEAHAMQDAVNSGPCVIAGFYANAREAKCIEYTGKRGERNGVDYYQVTYRIEFASESEKLDTDMWPSYDLRVLDRGWHYKSAGKRKRCQVYNQTNDLVEADTPQLLNGSGGQLAVGGTPVYLNFYMYKEAHFWRMDLATV